MCAHHDADEFVRASECNQRDRRGNERKLASLLSKAIIVGRLDRFLNRAVIVMTYLRRECMMLFNIMNLLWDQVLELI